MMWCVFLNVTSPLSTPTHVHSVPQGRHRQRYVPRTLPSLPTPTKHTAPTGLRLADKRSLPCPRRVQWLAARDELYEEIMAKAWNANGRFFAQSYEDLEILDSSLLIMPLVFFMPPVRRPPVC